MMPPLVTRGRLRLGIGVRAFALLGTGVGLAVTAIGAGPRTPLDIAMHVLMVVLLVGGLAWSARGRPDAGAAARPEPAS